MSHLHIYITQVVILYIAQFKGEIIILSLVRGFQLKFVKGYVKFIAYRSLDKQLTRVIGATWYSLTIND